MGKEKHICLTPFFKLFETHSAPRLNINVLLLHPSPPARINVAYKWFPLEAVKTLWKEPIYCSELAKSTYSMSANKGLFLEMKDKQRGDISLGEICWIQHVGHLGVDRSYFGNWMQYALALYIKKIWVILKPWSMAHFRLLYLPAGIGSVKWKPRLWTMQVSFNSRWMPVPPLSWYVGQYVSLGALNNIWKYPEGKRK